MAAHFLKFHPPPTSPKTSDEFNPPDSMRDISASVRMRQSNKAPRSWGKIGRTISCGKEEEKGEGLGRRREKKSNEKEREGRRGKRKRGKAYMTHITVGNRNPKLTSFQSDRGLQQRKKKKVEKKVKEEKENAKFQPQSLEKYGGACTPQFLAKNLGYFPLFSQQEKKKQCKQVAECEGIYLTQDRKFPLVFEGGDQIFFFVFKSE